MMPVDSMRGNISGRQDIEYNGADAYSVRDGNRVTSDNYQPRIVAKVMHDARPDRIKYFQVRTQTSINMTNGMRMTMALMGGAGAIYASLISDKTTHIYNDCVDACPKNMTLRQFVLPILREGLRAKHQQIVIAPDVVIDNPWITGGTTNVPVSPEILNKFKDVLR